MLLLRLFKSYPVGQIEGGFKGGKTGWNHARPAHIESRKT
jgi:hypothetical protein